MLCECCKQRTGFNKSWFKGKKEGKREEIRIHRHIPGCVGGPPVEERVSRGCHRDEARKVPLGVNPLGVPNPTTVWVTSGQTTTREGEQPNPSADNWSEVLLSKALPTRAKNSFSHRQSLPSTSLHKLLSPIHQKADRRICTASQRLKQKPYYRKLIMMKKQKVMS